MRRFTPGRLAGLLILALAILFPHLMAALGAEFYTILATRICMPRRVWVIRNHKKAATASPTTMIASRIAG